MKKQVVTDQQIIEAYEKFGSVWKVGEVLGIAGQTAHKRLVKLGINKPMNVFTNDDRKFLERHYRHYRDAGRLKDLAAHMKRTVPFLSRQAKELGLTNYSHPRKNISRWKYMDETTARIIFDEFKSSSLGLGMWCKKKGLDDLGFSRTMKEFWPDEWDHVIEAKAPALSRYVRGRAFEYRTRDHLRKAGFFVLRSPASKSPIDLVAIRKGTVLMVQCKRGGALPVGEWNELFDLAISTGSIPILAIALPKGIQYHRMIGRKDGSRSPQPFEPFTPGSLP